MEGAECCCWVCCWLWGTFGDKAHRDSAAVCGPGSADAEQEPRACLGAFVQQEIIQKDRPSSALGERVGCKETKTYWKTGKSLTFIRDFYLHSFCCGLGVLCHSRNPSQRELRSCFCVFLLIFKIIFLVPAQESCSYEECEVQLW